MTLEDKKVALDNYKKELERINKDMENCQNRGDQVGAMGLIDMFQELSRNIAQLERDINEQDDINK